MEPNPYWRIQKNTNKWGDNKPGFLTSKYDNGIITCRFDKRLKPYLLVHKKTISYKLTLKNRFCQSVPATLKGFIYYSKYI